MGAFPPGGAHQKNGLQHAHTIKQNTLKPIFNLSDPTINKKKWQAWGHKAGLGSQGRLVLARQAWAHKAGLGSQGTLGLTRQAWAHKAGLGSQGTPGLTRHGLGHHEKQNREKTLAKNKTRKKTNVSPTPNAYFSGQQFLSRGQCVKYSI